MERDVFQAWLAEADGLSARQREEAARVLAEPVSLASVLALLEALIDEARRCPRCEVPGAVIRGRSNGLRRYQCKGCAKTFNALTGTPLARLRKKELWAAFAAGLGEGDTVKGAAARCGVADTTSFRWRHRFLAAVEAGAVKLKGIVEADETYVLASRKGAKKLERKPRKRGGVAKKRGLSKEQVPILVAADRSGTTVTAVLPDTTAATITAQLAPAIEPDALLVTDGAPFFPPCARALRTSLGRQPPAARPEGRRAPPRRAPPQHRQQPPRTAQDLPPPPPRHRHQISRQLPRLVPPRHPAQAADATLRAGLRRRAGASQTASLHG